MSDGEYVHAVGTWQHLLGRAADILRLNSDSPRALCGVSLVVPDDVPEPHPDAPRCPACAAKGGFPA